VPDQPESPHASVQEISGTVRALESDGAAAQTSHPVLGLVLSDSHVKALPSTTLLGPDVPLYSRPFTISLSQPLSVLKPAVPLRSWPTARLVGVIVHDWLLP
jgi:hypothetical protein